MNLAGIITGIKFTIRHPDTDKPLSFGKVYTYEENSSTPKNTWKDEKKQSVNTNPITLDAKGQCDLFLDGNYRIVVRDANDNLIDSIDNIRDAASTSRDFANELITAYNQLTLDPEIVNAVAENLEPIMNVSDDIDSVVLVGENISSVNTNASNITAINTNAENITDIQNAFENATIATEQASIATSKANEASSSASSALSSKNTATSQAEIATSKANEATEQAAISTNKAGEALNSANTAGGHASNANDSANLALQYKNETQAIRESIENITANATTLNPNESATASFDTETNVLSFGIPQGIQGEQGPMGELTQESLEEIIGTITEFNNALQGV